MFKGSQVTVIEQLQDGIELVTDEAALSHIFTNLVLNSHKHGFDGGRKPGEIIVKLSQVDNDIILQISDNGLGIPQRVFEHIFSAYYTTATHSGGTGLGLSIVRDIVQQVLSGNIDVQSTIGQGSEFTITCQQ